MLAVPAGTQGLRDLAALLLIARAAAVLLFTNLGVRHLWQDEVANAVLRERMLKLGKPLAYDGVNLVTTDHAGSEDEASLDQRTGPVGGGPLRQVNTGAVGTPFGDNPDPGSQVPWGLLAGRASPEVLVLGRMDDGPPAGAAPATRAR